MEATSTRKDTMSTLREVLNIPVQAPKEDWRILPIRYSTPMNPNHPLAPKHVTVGIVYKAS